MRKQSVVLFVHFLTMMMIIRRLYMEGLADFCLIQSLLSKLSVF